MMSTQKVKNQRKYKLKNKLNYRKATRMANGILTIVTHKYNFILKMIKFVVIDMFTNLVWHIISTFGSCFYYLLYAMKSISQVSISERFFFWFET